MVPVIDSDPSSQKDIMDPGTHVATTGDGSKSTPKTAYENIEQELERLEAVTYQPT